MRYSYAVCVCFCVCRVSVCVCDLILKSEVLTLEYVRGTILTSFFCRCIALVGFSHAPAGPGMAETVTRHGEANFFDGFGRPGGYPITGLGSMALH